MEDKKPVNKKLMVGEQDTHTAKRQSHIDEINADNRKERQNAENQREIRHPVRLFSIRIKRWLLKIHIWLFGMIIVHKNSS